MDKTTFLVFSCLHCPVHDEEAVGLLVERVGKFQPDWLIDLGDTFEANASSRWDDEYDWTWTDELRAVNGVYARLREAAPNAKRKKLQGNHDANMMAEGRLPKAVRDNCDWRVPQYSHSGEWLNEELVKHWDVHDDYVYDQTGTWRIPSTQIICSHGYETTEGGIRREVLTLSHEYFLYIHGHTHRPTPVEKLRINATTLARYWTANAGCMRDLKPRYVKRMNTSRWGHAVVTGEARLLKSPRMGREWEAQTEILRMYDE